MDFVCSQLKKWGNPRALLVLASGLGLYSPDSFCYSYVQESRTPQSQWSLQSHRVELTPGGGAQRVHITLGITGNFNSHKEYVSCVSGCSDGVRYSTPNIEHAPWRMGVAMTAPYRITARSGGQSATFTIMGESASGRNYIGDGGASGSVRGMSFTDGITYHSSPWIGSFQTSTDATYIWHNERYGGNLQLSAPKGTPAGTYIYNGVVAEFNLQYCGTSCNPLFRQGRYWSAHNDSLTITVLGRCRFANSSLNIDYGSIRAKEAQGRVKKATTQLVCNSDVRAGKLKLVSTSGSNHTTPTGTSVKLRKGMDAIVTVNGKDASHGIDIPGPGKVPIEIASTLETYGDTPQPGPFQGNAVLSFIAN